MATMLLGGLWHGASWTFVVWGGLHGLYLAAERALRSRFSGYVPGPLALFALGLLTFALINITWVFFRAHGFEQAWIVLRGMFGGNADAKPILTTAHLGLVALIVGGIVIAHWLMRTRTLEAMLARRHPLPLSAALGAMAFAIVAAQGAGNAFIYFQF
jgi:alginate O-acetyltransferase complex protein AlgI